MRYLLLFDFMVFPDPRQRKYFVWFLALGEGFAGYGLWKQQATWWPNGALEAFHGSLVIDGFSIFFNWIFIAATLMVAIVSYKYLEIEGEHHAEYYSLMMFAQCGMFFLASGTDLVTLFIGLELMALSFYVMVGFLRTSKRSNEAAMKYLLLGAFSSGFLAYGFSVMYGISGSTKLADIVRCDRGARSRSIRWYCWRWPLLRSGCYSRYRRHHSTCGRRMLTKALRLR